MTVSKDFVLAGNATFTVTAPDKHRTYRVTFQRGTPRRNGEGNWPDAYFVHTLTGPNNETDYTYLGMMNAATGEVFTTRASKTWDGTLRLRLLNRVMARVWAGQHEAYTAAGYDVMHAGTCGRCGRKLTEPTSLTTGIGPECRKLYDLGLPPGTNAETKRAAKAAAPRKPRSRKAATTPGVRLRGSRPELVFDISDKPDTDVTKLTPHYVEGEITHWKGELYGVLVTIFND